MGKNDIPEGVIDEMAREFCTALCEFLRVPEEDAPTQEKLMYGAVRVCMERAVNSAFPPEDDRRHRFRREY